MKRTYEIIIEKDNNDTVISLVDTKRKIVVVHGDTEVGSAFKGALQLMESDLEGVSHA